MATYRGPRLKGRVSVVADSSTASCGYQAHCERNKVIGIGRPADFLDLDEIKVVILGFGIDLRDDVASSAQADKSTKRIMNPYPIQSRYSQNVATIEADEWRTKGR
ncbi:hypothetical protein MMC12_007176 [Toensbergia leucococca]|nr:hypothetical protein [Toensbergia leucococca]